MAHDGGSEMAWEHYESRMTGKAAVIVDGHSEDWDFSVGIVTTGRQRVFSRWFVQVCLPDGSRGSGESSDGPVQALRRLDDAFHLMGIRLLASGLDPRFYESGLSSGSCWGFMEGDPAGRAYSMMEVPPPNHRDPVEEAKIDALIAEAVATIGNSLLPGARQLPKSDATPN